MPSNELGDAMYLSKRFIIALIAGVAFLTAATVVLVAQRGLTAESKHSVTPTLPQGRVEMTDIAGESATDARVATNGDRVWWLLPGKDSVLVEQDGNAGVRKTVSLGIGSREPVHASIVATDDLVFLSLSTSFVVYRPSSGALEVKPLPESSLGADKASETSAPITALGIAADSVWITRDDTHELLRYDISRESFSAVDPPSDVDVPDYLRTTVDDVLIGERQRSPVPDKELFSFWTRAAAVDATAAWQPVQSTRPLYTPFSDGNRFWFDYNDMGRAAFLDGQTDTVSPTGRTFEHDASDVIAIDSTGSIWFRDGLDICRHDSITGQTLVYRLPRASSGDASTTPALTCSQIDKNGDLWFAYHAGTLRTGVARAP